VALVKAVQPRGVLHTEHTTFLTIYMALFDNDKC
jgi:hypothetical protein